ncbi:MAG: hypothetical protein KA114_01560 [Bacteroidales bacterium]|nr:hypothetical protein [Bacteroidales bacterium]
MNECFLILFLPVIAGLLLFLVPDKLKLFKGIVSLAITVVTFWFTIVIYRSGNVKMNLENFVPAIFLPSYIAPEITSFFTFNVDNLAKLIVLFISFFSFLINLYSLTYKDTQRINNYYPYFLLTLGFSYGAALADNMLVFITFWGILGLTLYKLIQDKTEEGSATAKKTLILIGSSDTIMIMGIAILWKMTGSLNMSGMQVPTGSALALTAFLAMLTGSFTKAGAFPFHTWVPDYTKDAPASSSAYMPASLDKLLGIYLLTRILTEIFVPGEWVTLLLLTLGVVTIITAVMMALIQHNYKRLLGYHAVSQVGYMIVGLSLGSFIGIAAGLFHMLNNALYKSGLILAAGAVEQRTGKTEIDDLGGLSKAMPVTFISALIFAMSISGIPPLNGFASKWMIYQAIIDFGGGTGIPHKLWVLWLVLAVLGSAFTLASFIKFIGGIFLGRRKTELENIKEVPALMWIPLAVIALLCIIFSVFATGVVVPRLLMPVTGIFKFSGIYNSSLASLMILVSILLGILIYLATGLRKFRTADSFIGGEKFYDKAAYPAPEFYKTITEFGFFSAIYRKAQEKWFDIYDLSKQALLYCSGLFSKMHTGVLSTYVLWVFAGLLILLLIML